MLILALVEPVFVWQENVKKKLAHAKIVRVTNSLNVFSNSGLRARAHAGGASPRFLLFFFPVY